MRDCPQEVENSRRCRNPTADPPPEGRFRKTTQRRPTLRARPALFGGEVHFARSLRSGSLGSLRTNRRGASKHRDSCSFRAYPLGQCLRPSGFGRFWRPVLRLVALLRDSGGSFRSLLAWQFAAFTHSLRSPACGPFGSGRGAIPGRRPLARSFAPTGWEPKLPSHPSDPKGAEALAAKVGRLPCWRESPELSSRIPFNVPIPASKTRRFGQTKTPEFAARPGDLWQGLRVTGQIAGADLRIGEQSKLFRSLRSGPGLNQADEPP